MKLRINALWEIIFVVGFILTVVAIYLYIGQISATVVAVAGLALPFLKLLFPHRGNRVKVFIQTIFSRPRTVATLAILIWICFVTILLVAGKLVIPWFVEHHNFRSEPKKITRETIKQLVVNKRLFDSHLNPTGKGITNLFNKQDVPNGKVVIDKSTGLMWEDSKVERFIHYSDAKDHVVKLNKEKWAGFQNWRLPTIEEAYSILEPRARKIDRYSLHLDPELGESYPFIWTSDINPDMMEPWVLSYLTGDVIVGVTNNITREYKFTVRAIRLIH